jgi:hypothetical protein
MIFSELYSAYYSAVAAILREAVKHPLRKDALRNIIEKKAFGESMLNIEPAIGDERWQIIHSDGTTPLKHVPTLPLTTLEKRWMKAIASDPRIRLFSDELPDFPDVEPLFKPEDISVFDKYSDGDPYEDEKYIKNFRLILQAVKDRRPLYIESANSKDKIIKMTLMPEYIEYSEKDDKFRLIASGRKHGATLNIARIIKCTPYNRPFEAFTEKAERREPEKVEFELYDRRNALERVLMHFAHFEKQAEKTGEDKYKVTIFYDKNDETEIVIRILSFGPMIKVTAPENFIELIKDRLLRQKNCGH